MITICVSGLADSRPQGFRQKIAEDFKGVVKNVVGKSKGDAKVEFEVNTSPVKTEDKVRIEISGEKFSEETRSALKNRLLQTAWYWLSSATNISAVFL